MGKKSYATSEGIREGDATQAQPDYDPNVFNEPPPPSSPHATEPAPAKRTREPYTKREAVMAILRVLDRVDADVPTKHDILTSAAALV